MLEATIEWINNFKKDYKNKSKDIIFWDIGSNIGLFSLYAAKIHKNCKVYSFEPSTSNLRILSRNIDINDLSERIKNLGFNAKVSLKEGLIKTYQDYIKV